VAAVVLHVEKSSEWRWERGGTRVASVQELATDRSGQLTFCRRAIARGKSGELKWHHVRSCKLWTTGDKTMQWTAPAFEEVCLNC